MTSFSIRTNARKIATHKAVVSALLSAVLLVTMAASPALAMANNGLNGSGKTKADLEGEGWTCVVVATGWWSCTKPGEKEQWCDTGSCGPAPFKITKPRFPARVPTNNVMTTN